MPIKVNSKKEDKIRFLNIFKIQDLLSWVDELRFQYKLYPNFLLIDILSKLEDIKSLFWYVIYLLLQNWQKKNEKRN